MIVTAVLRIAASCPATGSQVSAPPAALAWPATPSDPAWVRTTLTRGISAQLVAGEAAGDKLNRTKSRLVPVQLIPRSVLAAGGGAPPAARSRQCASAREADGQRDLAVPALLSEHSPSQPWWLGYLDTGVDDMVFPGAPMVTLYSGWHDVLVEAGPEQAATGRENDPGRTVSCLT